MFYDTERDNRMRNEIKKINEKFVSHLDRTEQDFDADITSNWNRPQTFVTDRNAGDDLMRVEGGAIQYQTMDGKGILSDVEDFGEGALGGLLGGKKEKPIKKEKPVKKEKTMKKDKKIMLDDLIKEIKAKKQGAGLFGDLGEIVGTVAPEIIGGKKKKQTKKDKEDEKLSMEIKGVKDVVEKKKGRPKKNEGAGIIDDIKKVAKRAVKTIKSGAKIFKKEGDLKDLANVLSLGKYEGGAKENIQESNLGVKNVNQVDPQKTVNDIIANGGAKKLKKGGKLIPKSSLPGSSMGFGVKKPETAWAKCLRETKEKHPELKGLKEIIDYVKKNNLYKKK